MDGVQETQYVEGFDAIINWPETQELLSAARRCLGRFHNLSELNDLDVSTHEPSNQEISHLLHYLAQKALDVTPHNTQHSNYAPSTAAWLDAPGPWNPLGGIRSLSTETTVPSSATVRPGLSNSFPSPRPNPRNATNHETQLFSSISQPQPTLPAESKNLDVLNSTLAQAQFLHYGVNSLTYQPINAPAKNGCSSIACSNDTSQVDFPWSRESQKTSITTPPFHSTPHRRSHQTVIAPLSTSSKSLEDDCSPSLPHRQGGSSVVGSGSRRERPLTYAEAARSSAEQVPEIPEPAASPATTIGSNIQKNKFSCDFEGCDKTFEWEWKFKDHWKVHTKEKSICCTACNAYFGRNRDLVKHRQSQKHKKATQPIQSVTSNVDTNLTLNPAACGKIPGSFLRPPRERKTRSTVGSSRDPLEASSTSVADCGEMEMSGDTGDQADGTVHLPSDPTAGGSLTQASICTSRTRSVKRIRTISDIDTNNEDKNSTEAPKDPDSESFGTSPRSPATNRSRNLAHYPLIPSSRSNRSSSSLSPTQISNRRRQTRILNTNTSANVSSVASSNVPAITFSPSAMLPTAQSQDWMYAAADDRTTTSSVMTAADDYMAQYINMDFDPPTPATKQPILWHTSGCDTLSTISTRDYPQDLPARSYGAGSDEG